jgi:hypothetical protein
MLLIVGEIASPPTSPATSEPAQAHHTTQGQQSGKVVAKGEGGGGAGLKAELGE